MPQSRPIERKLTTILAADAANYSGRMNSDEEGTVRALRGARDVIDGAISARGGRIANTSGDGLIAEFPSVVSAVRCAIEVQQTLNARDDLLPFRLGVHLDDVIVEGADLLGDGVNLAARLQEMAEIGGILVSQQVHDHVRGKVSDVTLRPLGPAMPKNINAEIGLYAVETDGVVAPMLADNLGPKLPRRGATATPDISNPETEPNVHRATFVKRRNGLLWALGATIGADVLFGLPIGIMIIPEGILIYLLYRAWRRYRDAVPISEPN